MGGGWSTWPSRYPCRHRENMQIPHRKATHSIWLWFMRTNYYKDYVTKLKIWKKKQLKFHKINTILKTQLSRFFVTQRKKCLYFCLVTYKKSASLCRYAVILDSLDPVMKPCAWTPIPDIFWMGSQVQLRAMFSEHLFLFSLKLYLNFHPLQQQTERHNPETQKLIQLRWKQSNHTSSNMTWDVIKKKSSLRKVKKVNSTYGSIKQRQFN